MDKLVIYGLGDLASLLRHFISETTESTVVAFCADRDFVNSESHEGLPVVAFEELSERFPPATHNMILAVGYSDMRTRISMFERAAKSGYRLINYIHPTAFVDSTVKIGANNIVFPGSIIEPHTCVGDNNVIWSSVIISHNSTLNNHSFLASQSLVGGYCEIGDNCFLGFGATVLQGVSIAKETLVAAGAIVTEDTQAYTKMIGMPARAVDSHESIGIKVR